MPCVTSFTVSGTSIEFPTIHIITHEPVAGAHISTTGWFVVDRRIVVRSLIVICRLIRAILLIMCGALRLITRTLLTIAALLTIRWTLRLICIRTRGCRSLLIIRWFLWLISIWTRRCRSLLIVVTVLIVRRSLLIIDLLITRSRWSLLVAWWWALTVCSCCGCIWWRRLLITIATARSGSSRVWWRSRSRLLITVATAWSRSSSIRWRRRTLLMTIAAATTIIWTWSRFLAIWRTALRRRCLSVARLIAITTARRRTATRTVAITRAWTTARTWTAATICAAAAGIWSVIRLWAGFVLIAWYCRRGTSSTYRPSMIAAQNCLIPNRIVTTLKLILAKAALSIRHTSIKLSTIVGIAYKTVLMACRTGADWRIWRPCCRCFRCCCCRCYDDGWWTSRRRCCYRRRRRRWCHVRISSTLRCIAVDFVEMFRSAALGSSGIGRMYAHIQFSWENRTGSAWELKRSQFAGRLIDASIENCAVVFVSMKAFGWAWIVGEFTLR